MRGLESWNPLDRPDNGFLQRLGLPTEDGAIRERELRGNEPIVFDDGRKNGNFGLMEIEPRRE